MPKVCLNSARKTGTESADLFVVRYIESALSLSDPAPIIKLDVLMKRFERSPHLPVLEVTETILMTDVQQGTDRLNALPANGYGMSLDDFGTGCSPLNDLKRFLIDELKIDRSFVIRAERGGRVCFERGGVGVETLEPALFLINRSCPEQPGFGFPKPVPDAAFELLLRDGLPASKAVVATKSEPAESVTV